MQPRPRASPFRRPTPLPARLAWAFALLAAPIGCGSGNALRGNLVRAEPSYERQTAIRPSQIPHGGDGLFALVKIKAGQTVGVYGGRLVSDADCPTDESYVVILDDCAVGKIKPYLYVDGKGSDSHVTRANFAPSSINGAETHFQNASIDTLCDYPFVRYVATRDIEVGEEIWTSYGEEYDYDRFMQDREVQRFFCARSKVDCSTAFKYGF
jgi:hypothetical protein